jgi:5'-nucleotidase
MIKDIKHIVKFSFILWIVLNLFTFYCFADNLIDREIANKAVSWRLNKFIKADSLIRGKILGINDFHGQIAEGKVVGGRPVGGAAVLTSYLRNAQKVYQNSTFYISVGDLIGGSSPESALLQDEPTIMFFNMLGNSLCSYEDKYNELCNVIGIPGNHEFDEGIDELIRIINGGNHINGPFLEDSYKGINFAFISSNIIYNDGKPFLKPYTIKTLDNIPIGFIGAILRDAPTIVTPSAISGLEFLDEADIINSYVNELKSKNIKSIVVLIHQGGTQNDNGDLKGAISDIVENLDDEVDIVLSGHSHTYINTLAKNKNGHSILVTQAFSSGTAYSDIDFAVDKKSGDVVEKTAKIVTTYADDGPGLQPDVRVQELVEEVLDQVDPIINREITISRTDITRQQNEAGESALGNLIADAQRWQMDTDFAFMNSGGIRDDIKAGVVTYGNLYSVQPFGNTLVKMELTGKEIKELLMQQWGIDGHQRMLQISGLSYVWDASKDINERLTNIVDNNNMPLDDKKTYSITVNSFLADGGDGFTVLENGKNREVGPTDLDGLVNYLEQLQAPIYYTIDGRIKKTM